MRENHPLVEARMYGCMSRTCFSVSFVYMCICGPGPAGSSPRIVTKTAACAIERQGRFSYTLVTGAPILRTADMITSEQPLEMTIQQCSAYFLQYTKFKLPQLAKIEIERIELHVFSMKRLSRADVV